MRERIAGNTLRPTAAQSPLRWLAALPFLAILLGTPFVNRATPLVLGFPPILLWLTAWVVLTSAIMALIYITDPANRTPLDESDAPGNAP